MKGIFIGREGLRAGWRFAVFLVLAQLAAKGMFAAIGGLGYREPEGWTAIGFIVEGGISAAAGILAAAVLARFEKRPLAEYGYRD